MDTKENDRDNRAAIAPPGDEADLQTAQAQADRADELPDADRAADAADWTARHARREADRAAARQRARLARERPEGVIIPADPQPSAMDAAKRRVAVYARVSTSSLEQTSSIENQQLYYEKKIAENPNWEMTRIYKDEGKSGTSIRHRDGFKEMMADAANKRMEMILCASVSRFSRNISECIEQARLLRVKHPSHPVGVYFETENIYTLDPSASERFEMQALLASWESANRSRRMILTYDQLIVTKQYPVSDLLGYRHTKAKQLLIEPEEAKTVRFAFLARLAGDSDAEIAAFFSRIARKTRKGRVQWNAAMVRAIRQSERHWGDLQVRKRITIDYRERKTVKNVRKRVAALVHGHHDGIVTPEIAKAARLVDASGERLNGGVPAMLVIPEGALKGFVSVCPAWRGIDGAAFLSLCQSVYGEDAPWESEGEKTPRARESGYLFPSGADFLGPSAPTLTLSRAALALNAACHRRLGDCAFVEILYHPLLRAVAIRACDQAAQNAVRWVGRAALKVSAGAFAGAIYEGMRWPSGYRFRFRGAARAREAHRLLLFLLDEPRALPDKRGAPAANAAPAQAVPNEWRAPLGVPYARKQRGDDVIRAVTQEDLSRAGVSVPNPLLGDIPNKDELKKELDRLRKSME